MVVLYEDQQKINLFAKKNTLFNDIKEQIVEKEVWPRQSSSIFKALYIVESA